MRPDLVPDSELDRLIDPEIRAEIGDPVPVTLAATTVYLPVLAVGLALSVFWQETIPGPRFSLPEILADLGIGTAVGLAMVLVTWKLARSIRALQELEIEFRKVLGHLPPSRIIALALLSGVAEEVMFRGTLQPWLGYVLVSLIFGCLHFVPSMVFLPWTIFAIAAGFVFGGLFEWRASLVAPITAHVLVNSVNLHLIVSGKRLPES